MTNQAILNSVQAHPSRIAALSAFIDSQNWSDNPFEPVASPRLVIEPASGTVTAALAFGAASSELSAVRAELGLA